MTVDERFWPKVRKTDTCWLWTASVNRDGYGWFGNGERVIYAHTYLVGVAPKGMNWDHLCRVRNCVRPDHLELVSMKENILRGVGAPARNARKTHCVRGHEFTPGNTYVLQGRRTCRTCQRVRRTEYEKRHSAMKESGR